MFNINVHNGFCTNLYFAKCEKLSFFGPFLAKFWLIFKKHYKIGISAHFLKQTTKTKKMSGYYLVQVGAIIWSKLGAFKNCKLVFNMR